VTHCSNCGADNPAASRFCGNCGLPLAVTCSVCGAPNDPSMRFCTQCGSTMGAEAAPAVATLTPPASNPAETTAERRLVSILFADLVGFTPWSESRDAEEARDLLSRYFEMSRTLIARYGGTIEKFIGDAVMAV
jgi:hypothetical protein